MLAWIPSAPQTSHAYMPSRSSPLAPRHSNVVRRQPLAPTTNTSHNVFTFSMDPASKPSTPAPPQRSVKPNPLIQKTAGDAGRERRRDMFLKKVANDRDERRWAGRAEQVRYCNPRSRDVAGRRVEDLSADAFLPDRATGPHEAAEAVAAAPRAISAQDSGAVGR
ncbi:hypothetical protein BK809_0005049 [Diplodia seriata]|uniref:Uncharacterized protein n=1 Tax=Diplodia seriata TaxID=420778 RepID=A0A1S8B8G9_9PEZI|nr:hypothetical protein BK809_0005049 [Diplodia seriata]